MTVSTIHLTRPETDVALLTLDHPERSANILSSAVLDELEERLNEVDGDTSVRGLVIISGKPGMFIAGADIREFAASFDMGEEKTIAASRRGQQLFMRLATARYVTVAAIDGICLGGGAELATWCDRRIMTTGPKTQLGFPEVKLGLFPGWGGTARVPRMIGLYNAIEMITSGESIDDQAAWKMGLADDIVSPELLLESAVRMVREEQQTKAYLADRQRWSAPLPGNDVEMGFLGVTASGYIRQQTKGQYPAPEAALETMLETAGMDIEQACEKEAETMASLFGSSVNRSLINVFLLTERNKKDGGVDGHYDAEAIDSVCVIGSGIMGAGIAAANVKRQVSVALADASDDALDAGIANVLEEVAYNRQTKSADPDRMLHYTRFLRRAADQWSGVDLVVEAIVENAEVKRQLYAKIEPQLDEQTILASNTSTIPITQLAAGLKRPENFCGLHFFNPVRRMKLVEVIRGEATSDETVARAVTHAKRIGKMPIVLRDGPGFLVNRLLFPYMNEAMQLVQNGVEIAHIDRVAKRFGMPMGPIELYDMVGLDTALYAGRVMLEAFPDRIVASPILPALVKRGWLGAKSGQGFYIHQGKRKRGRLQVNPEFQDIASQYVRPTDIPSDEQIESRLFVPMLLEATRVLEEELVRDPRDVDLGLIFGIGFPPFRGGLLHWADQVGADKLLADCETMQEIATRYQPTEMLSAMAKNGRQFYPK
jgi:3-hydroxyacyl-CoA dehydrogenase/enoyl-CoA hydratase/3-hydroxybutyryl-CoA epimerase/3-hydroxyacyl-CoA dehydrogenase/enoyl-CoA hydratase/3-hydroxybutyryl-CoA epimerase/enoyl-CoA isomerase